MFESRPATKWVKYVRSSIRTSEQEKEHNGLWMRLMRLRKCDRCWSFRTYRISKVFLNQERAIVDVYFCSTHMAQALVGALPRTKR